MRKITGIVVIVLLGILQLSTECLAQDAEVPDVTTVTHNTTEVLQWTHFARIYLDSNKKFDFNPGYVLTFNDLGEDYQSMIYIASIRSKLMDKVRLYTVYAGGDIEHAGWLNAILIGPQFEFNGIFLNPSIRLSYNYVWFGGGQDQGVPKPEDNHRIRLRFLGREPLSENQRIQLLVLAESFLYKSVEGAFKELRTNIGPYFVLNKNIGVAPVYGYRWSENDFSVVNQHSLMFYVNMTF